MKRFSIWLKENKHWNEDGATHKIAPRHTVHIHTSPTSGESPSQTSDYQQSQSRTQATHDHGTVNNTDHDFHDHPVVNRLLNIMKHDIDSLTWDYGKDSVEMVIDNVLEAVPNMKAQCDRLKGCWKAFKDRLYKELREGFLPWGKKASAINPVVYDVALVRIKGLEKVLGEIEKLCGESEQEELKQLFLTFWGEYGRVMPGMKKQIEKLQKTTPRR
jgi:hypothetical protein